MTVSMLDLEHGHLRKELNKLLGWLESEPRPDVVNLPYTLLIGLAAPLRKSLQSPVCCTLQGEDLFLEGLQEPYKSRALDLIRQNIPHVDCFLAVSEYYAEFMCRYLGIPDRKMEIAPLGVTTDGYRAAPSSGNEKPRIGYFARIAPEKGLHILADAYKLVREAGCECTLEAAGYIAPEQRAYLEGIEKQLREWGIEFHYHGAVDRSQKIAFLESLDVLSTPTVYADPKGMFVLEAMAAGVPVVEPDHGAFPEIIRKTGGGILVEPENPRSLADGLLKVLRDRELRDVLGRRAYSGVREHYRVDAMAAKTVEIFARQKSPVLQDA
jgi:glycosyltransferase involved in cell wall biosynthesis